MSWARADVQVVIELVFSVWIVVVEVRQGEGDWLCVCQDFAAKRKINVPSGIAGNGDDNVKRATEWIAEKSSIRYNNNPI